MDKNIIITIIIVIVLAALGVIGYAMWNASNTSEVTTQTPSSTSNQTSTSGSNLQPGMPIVQTNSNTAPYISTVVVKGSVNPNGASTTYWYEYGETTALGSKTSSYLLGSGYAAFYTPAYITGLKSNTNYYFRLSAKNNLGTVEGATYSFKTNTTPAPEGTAPTTSTTAAGDVTRTTANLNGRVNPNGSETTYWFEYGLTAELGGTTAFQSAGNGKSSASVAVSISNIQPLTKYYFRLNAQNEFGTINGQILNFTTKGPASLTVPAATTNSATAVTDSSAKLNASVNPNGAMTTYWFEYSDNSLLSNVIVSTTEEQSLNNGSTAENVSANVNNLNSDTKYYFKIVAKNQYGTVRGETQSFTTKK